MVIIKDGIFSNYGSHYMYVCGFECGISYMIYYGRKTWLGY